MATPKLSDAEKVDHYLAALEHPLRAELEMVRQILKGSHQKLSERIKWNAPSYYYRQDLVTFNPRNQRAIHLVFHHPVIVEIESGLLEGDYKDRRMVYFPDKNSIETHQPELERIMRELIARVEGVE